MKTNPVKNQFFMEHKLILIDNGHGIDTPGKRSPDGKLLEYQYNRIIAVSVLEHLALRGIRAELVVPEENDIPLKERCRRINETCLLFGTRNTTLLSIHVNAAGMGKDWMPARGWCAYTSPGKTQADSFADCLYAAAEQTLPGQRIRKDMVDGDPDFESSFAILSNTLCPAVLTENLFMDNPEDCRFLLSDAGKKAIIGLHVRAICKYYHIYA